MCKKKKARKEKVINYLRASAISPILVLLQNYTMKVLQSSHISPFGGLNFVHEELNRQNIRELLNSHLPILPPQNKYDWFDILASYWSIFFCGGDCAEDLDINLRNGLINNPYLAAPSPDRLLNRLKELSKPAERYKSKRGVSINEFCFNDSLNHLNLKLIKQLNLLPSEKIILDYDNTIVFNEKADAKMSYKKKKGYSPGVAIIDKHVVYVENHNGNSAPHALQEITFRRMSNILREEQVKIDIIRADGASYMFETVLAMREIADTLFIRAVVSTGLAEIIKTIKNWEPVIIDGKTCFRGTTIYTPFQQAARRAYKKDQLEQYRLVVTKTPNEDGQLNIFTEEAYEYSAIMTNDFEMSNDEVVFFYNGRGAKEREFDVLKNDFGWNNMPFSKLEQNNVFLIVMAMCKNIYNYLISVFSTKVMFLKPHYRIKKFIFRFICIPAKWIKTGRVLKLRLFGHCPT